MRYTSSRSKKTKTVPQLAGEYERARLERDELTVQFQRMTEKEKLGPEGKANMRKNNRAQHKTSAALDALRAAIESAPNLWTIPPRQIRRPSDWRCGNACTAIGCGCQDYEQARDT